MLETAEFVSDTYLHEDI